jgi:hypothetical protein
MSEILFFTKRSRTKLTKWQSASQSLGPKQHSQDLMSQHKMIKYMSKRFETLNYHSISVHIILNDLLNKLPF